MPVLQEPPKLSPDSLEDQCFLLGLPRDRIRLNPPPGTATEDDLIAALEGPRKRICELIEGTLVEKAMGAKESLWAIVIGSKLEQFVFDHDLGVVLGADGTIRFAPGLVRIPDVCFISWDRLPKEEFPEDPIPDLVPNLAIEVFSIGNTKAEMKRKVQDYFNSGVRMVWIVYPKSRTAEIYTSPTEIEIIPENGALAGGAVLPGFQLPLKDLFARRQRRKRED